MRQDEAEPDDADHLEGHAELQDAHGSHALRQRRAQAGRDEGSDREREQDVAGLQGVVPARGLQEERQREQQAELPEADHGRDHVAGAERLIRNSRRSTTTTLPLLILRGSRSRNPVEGDHAQHLGDEDDGDRTW